MRSGAIRFGVVSWLMLSASLSHAAALTHALGCRPPTPAEQARDDERAIVVSRVELNRLGLTRVNEERAAAGVSPLREAQVPLAADGREFSGATRNGGRAVSTVTQAATEAAPTDITALLAVGTEGTALLPASVDNSTSRFFPPIDDQSSIGSCAAFSTTFYTMTYMVARANNWNVTGSTRTNKFSPKFIYNMINGGSDNGSYITSAYNVMQSCGVPFWSVWPYDSSYTQWPTNAAIWRNSIPFRMGDYGSLPNLDTAAGLAAAKGMLANGYILNMSLDIDGWHFTTIKNDPSTTADDALVGWPIVDYAAVNSSGHAMTIVGYDDTVWCDINNNGVIDPGEKGAFKVCNQWGTGWQRNGFAYVAYDALKSVSAISGAHNTSREAAFWYEMAYFIQARPAGYVPSLLAECTLNTANRGGTSVSLGFASTTNTAPTTWSPSGLSYDGGAWGFNGDSVAVDGNFVLDFSDMADASAPHRWFMGVYQGNASTPCAVKAYKLTDAAGVALATCSGVSSDGIVTGPLPQSAAGSTVYTWAETNLSDALPPASTTDLVAVANGPTSALLTWTAPGNNGMSGKATGYDLRYSAIPITTDNFVSASTAVTPSPGTAGSTEQTTVTGLVAGATTFFAIKTCDSAGNWSGVSDVAQAALPDTLRIVSASPLPGAAAGVRYGTLLQATGGVSPYSWSIITGYIEDTNGTAALSTGTGLGWRTVDASTNYVFPDGFVFPFNGTNTTYLSLTPNGILTFPEADRATINPFNCDLVTTGSGEDIYVTALADRITFRWKAHQYGASGVDGSVNFEATLFVSGRVRFTYGAIGNCSLLPTIGIFGNQSCASARDGSVTIPAGATSLFSRNLPAGLTLDAGTGLLAGMPPAAVTNSLAIAVTDSGVPPQAVTNVLSLTVAASGLCLSPSATALQVPMGGSTNVWVALSAAPAGPLVVTASGSSGDTNIGITGGSTLAFDAGNWSVPQSVTLCSVSNRPNGTAIVTLSAPGLADVAILVTESDPPPVIFAAAVATPNPVTGTNANLSVMAVDNNGAAGLTYAWSTTGTPPASVTFVINNGNNASNTVAAFAKAGVYGVRAVATDGSGGVVTSLVNVVVNQTLTTIAVAPASATIGLGSNQQFTATAYDQFGSAIAPQPTLTWSANNGGSITTAGLFTAATYGLFTVNAAAGAFTGTATVGISPPAGPGTGITWEWYTSITGTSVADLTNAAKFVASQPDQVSTLTNGFETPANIADNYGSRVRAYYIAPVTASNYVFWIASDDTSELWLSPDLNPANKVRIANVPGYTDSRSWLKYPSQQSGSIALVAGQRYYIEALMKEGTGSDNLAVGADINGVQERPIPAHRLDPWTVRSAVTVVSTVPTVGEASGSNGVFTLTRTQPVTNALTVNLAVSGSASNGVDYAWIGPSVTFPTGVQAVAVNVSPINDAIAEGPETVSVTVTSGSNYTVGVASSATVTILDDEPVVKPDFTAWRKNLAIGFAGYTKAETLTNFPVLVRLGPGITNFSYADFAGANGCDLRFSDASGSAELNYEIDTWNTNGTSLVWVQVPALTNGGGIRAYWGNASAAGLGAPAYTTNGAVWGGVYAGVWHFSWVNGVPNLNDSGPNRWVSTNYAGAIPNGPGASSNVSACLGNGQDFGLGMGNTNCILTGARDGILVPTATSPVSFSYWCRLRGNASNDGRSVNLHRVGGAWGTLLNNSFNGSGGVVSKFQVNYNDGSQLRSTLWNSPPPTGVWFYATTTYDGSQVRLYTNGTFIMTSPALGTYGDPTLCLTMGDTSPNAAGTLDGYLDEVRVSTSALSSNWVWACYQDEVSNSTFCIYGSVTGVTWSALQQWRFDRFGTPSATGQAADGADPDGDGIPNLAEYAMGLDPNVGEPLARPAPAVLSGCLSLTYRQSKGGTGVSFIVEGTDDLLTGTWSTTGIVEWLREDMGTYWSVTDRDAVAMSNAVRRFLRLSVTTP